MLLSLVSFVAVAQPVMAKKDAKSLGAPLLLLAATGGLGYVAKKAYSRMKQASTVVEREQAHRRLIMAILGALIAGAGTAYAGHGYLTDSAEEQEGAPQVAAVVSARKLEGAAAGSSASASAAEVSGEGEEGRMPEEDASARQPELTPVVVVEKPIGNAAASRRRTERFVASLAPVAEGRSSTIAAAQDLACLRNNILNIQHVGDDDFHLTREAATRIKAVLDRDRVSGTEFCASFMPNGQRKGALYILYGNRPDSLVQYLYIFDINGNQKDSNSYQGDFLESSVITARYKKVFQGADEINRRLDQAIDGSADVEIPVSTLNGEFQVNLPSGMSCWQISLRNGKVSEDLRNRLMRFNLAGRAALPSELAEFPLVVRFKKHGSGDFMLCIDNELNCRWFTSTGTGVQPVTDARRIRSQFFSGREFTLVEPPFSGREIAINVDGHRQLPFVLDGTFRVRLHSERPVDQLYWDYVDLNWQDLFEVPATSDLSRSDKYPIVLNFTTADGSTLFIGLGTEERGCLAVMNNGVISNTELQVLIMGGLQVQTPVQSAEVRNRLFSRDLLQRIDTRPAMEVAGILFDDSRATREVLSSFQGANQSLVFTLLKHWDDSRAEAFANIVECLQEEHPGFDWVEDGANGRKPLCVAVDAGKPAMVQALLGLRHAGKTAALVQAPGNTSAQTILHYAIYRAEPSLLRALFTPQENVEHRSAQLAVDKLKAAINRPNQRGETPLMIAMQMADFEYARVLLDNGAGLALAQPQGEDILDYAARVSTQEMFNQLYQYLIQRGDVAVDQVTWQLTINPAPAVPRLTRMQSFRALDGRSISVDYDAAAGLMTANGMRGLHSMNCVGTAVCERFAQLQGYPLVVRVVSYGKAYLMCVKPRGEVKVFCSPGEGATQLREDRSECFGPQGTVLHVIRSF